MKKPRPPIRAAMARYPAAGLSNSRNVEFTTSICLDRAASASVSLLPTRVAPRKSQAGAASVDPNSLARAATASTLSRWVDEAVACTSQGSPRQARLHGTGSTGILAAQLRTKSSAHRFDTFSGDFQFSGVCIETMARTISASSRLLSTSRIKLRSIFARAGAADAGSSGSNTGARNHQPRCVRQAPRAASDVDRALRILHYRGLGELELQHCRQHRCLLQRRFDPWRTDVLLELRGGQITRTCANH